MHWFNSCSGLKINYEICELFGIRADSSLVRCLANVFGCKVGSFPSKYLGLSLCMGLLKISLWDPVVERIENLVPGKENIYL